jgi:uncharacterized membrane protein YuzA (DUF378 family)
MNSILSGSLLILIGVLVMLGATLNWRIISRSKKLLSILFGDTAARVIYFVVGVWMFIMGVGRLIGANWLRL